MTPDATDGDMQRVLACLAELNWRGELTVRVEHAIITVVGPSMPALEEDVRILGRVDCVVRLEQSYKHAGLDSNPGRTRPPPVGAIEVGGPDLLLIAGLGSVESAEQVAELAPILTQAGVGAITGPRFGPTSRPTPSRA